MYIAEGNGQPLDWPPLGCCFASDGLKTVQAMIEQLAEFMIFFCSDHIHVFGKELAVH